MNARKLFFIGGLLIGSLSACNFAQVTPVPAVPTPTVFDLAAIEKNEIATLSSLEKVDDYPLYTMRYYGEYDFRRVSTLIEQEQAGSGPSWACALFTVLLDDEHLLYGRNFDWEFSPALLVFTDPPDGYASVSMVDMAYLEIGDQDVLDLTDLPLEEREGLLYAPLIPFDGMNEHGLAIGMAAVPPGGMKMDPTKETRGSLGIIREILDHARGVDEAVAILESHNVDFESGPPVHYLIADATRKSVLVEFYRGEMNIFENKQPWHLATNFLLSSVDDPQDENCWRYDTIDARLNETQGMLDPKSAMDLLAEVSQDITQWSVVYQMAQGEVSVAMGRDYAQVYDFKMSDYLDLK
jgi:hypothetical protein